MSNRPAKPDNMPWLTPCLTVKDPDASVAFYNKAFGFEKRFSMPGPDGHTVHAEVTWRDGVIMLGPECPKMKTQIACDHGRAAIERPVCLLRRRGRFVQTGHGGWRRRGMSRHKTCSGAIECVR